MYRSTFSRPQHKFEVSGQLYVPAALPPVKGLQYPMDRRLGWALERYGEVKILDPTGTRTPIHRSSSTLMLV
jgi:hypothetical protein